MTLSDKELIILEKLLNSELDAIHREVHFDSEYFNEICKIRAKVISMMDWSYD